MTEVRVKFKSPAKLGQDAALALEDYARAASTFDAIVVLDREHHVTGVHLAAGKQTVPDAVTQDIERFFDSLVSRARSLPLGHAADRLGWS